MPRLHRTVGDHGSKARITVRDVTDADGQTVTAGTLTLRAQSLFEAAMTHDTDGTWFYDPQPGDIHSRGAFRLDVVSENTGVQVSIPSDSPWILEVRDPVSGT